jgi:hypothetical protein
MLTPTATRLLVAGFGDQGLHILCVRSIVPPPGRAVLPDGGGVGADPGRMLLLAAGAGRWGRWLSLPRSFVVHLGDDPGLVRPPKARTADSGLTQMTTCAGACGAKSR